MTTVTGTLLLGGGVSPTVAGKEAWMTIQAVAPVFLTGGELLLPPNQTVTLSSDGSWSADVEPLPEGYAYKFVANVGGGSYRHTRTVTVPDSVDPVEYQDLPDVVLPSTPPDYNKPGWATDLEATIAGVEGDATSAATSAADAEAASVLATDAVSGLVFAAVDDESGEIVLLDKGAATAGAEGEVVITPATGDAFTVPTVAGANAAYSTKLAEVRLDASVHPNGSIPATTDTGEPLTTFASPTAPAPLAISGGLITHTPYAGAQSAGYVQAELDGRVRRIGCTASWPTSALGVLAIVIPSAAWSSGVLPNAGFHLTIFGNGQWTLTRYTSGGSTTLASHSTHGRWNTVWGTGLVSFDIWIDLENGAAVICWPDGSSTRITSSYFTTETSNYAIWELFENNGATDVSASIGNVWASSQSPAANTAFLTPFRAPRIENPATYNASGSLTIQFGQTTVHEVTLVGNLTALAFAGTPRRGEILHLELVQDGTGSRTLAGVATAIKWAGATAPTLSTTAGRRDIFRFRYNGANWYEVSRSMNVAL